MMLIQEYLMELLTLRDGVIVRILLITPKVVDKFLWIFSVAGCLTDNKHFDYGANPDQDPEVFNGIFTTAG